MNRLNTTQPILHKTLPLRRESSDELQDLSPRINLSSDYSDTTGRGMTPYSPLPGSTSTFSSPEIASWLFKIMQDALGSSKGNADCTESIRNFYKNPPEIKLESRTISLEVVLNLLKEMHDKNAPASEALYGAASVAYEELRILEPLNTPPRCRTQSASLGTIEEV